MTVAHTTAATGTTDAWWSAWVVDVASLAVIAVLTAAYLHGNHHLATRRVGRRGRTAPFLVGIATVVLAHTGPPAALATQLFWSHMIQHLLLILVAAPLIAAGAPTTTVRAGLPPAGRHAAAILARRSRRARRALGDPPAIFLATAAHVTTLWLWHVPVVYDAAVTNHLVHLLEHATLLATAVWFWSEVWATARRHRRHQALATLCLGAMIVQGGVLGALLTFAGRSLYTVHTGGAGLTALEDQQLAGALMWVPPGFVYASVAARRFAAWFGAADGPRRSGQTADPTGSALP